MKCKECGARISSNSRYCESCGAVFSYTSDSVYTFNSPVNIDVAQEKDSYYESLQPDSPPDTSSSSGTYTPRTLNFDPHSVTVKSTSIPLCVFLQIITIGLFGIYWRNQLNKDLNKLVGNKNTMKSLYFVLLVSFTIGVFDFSWQYMMGENVDLLRKNKVEATGYKYVIRRLFLLDIFNYVDMQKTVNSFAKEK